MEIMSKIGVIMVVSGMLLTVLGVIVQILARRKRGRAMIKRYCDRCGQQIDEGVYAWYVLELNGTDGEFRHKELCEECYAYLFEDEPLTCDGNCWMKKQNGEWLCEHCQRKPQTEPTISKMEQVAKDINVRSKTEPQTEREGE